jgi:hypothetical protein
MSIAATQASAFYEQAAKNGSVFTFLEDGSWPMAKEGRDGMRRPTSCAQCQNLACKQGKKRWEAQKEVGPWRILANW